MSMTKKSAGILMFRDNDQTLEVLLAHPGGPYWKNKDEGVWTIPKGEYENDESPLEAAKREFLEETGLQVTGNLKELGTVKQPSGKEIIAYAAEGNCDPSEFISNTFSLEWPPKSGAIREFPEIDRAEWFSISMASRKILKGQRGFLPILCSRLGFDYDELVASEQS
jgi:predicted NUDIX family NTP pyrophosphohydrolase